VDFECIGKYELNTEGCQLRITIDTKLKDAMMKLDQFSHCVIFTMETNAIHCYVVKIVKINEAIGEMLVETEENVFIGDLIDIKPYFPCEEQVEGYDKNLSLHEKGFKPLSFQGSPIGKFFNAPDDGRILLQESENAFAEEIIWAIKHIKEGTFLRILWWFDRFEDKKYRRHLTCKPPYDNAPRCGVFATRSPVRPNPLASTIVKVKAVDAYHKCISVLGFDGFDNSIILQIMPYNECDIPGARVPEWVAHWTDRKVFLDAPEIEVYSNSNSNKTAYENATFFDELESSITAEQLDITSNEVVVEGASIHNLKNITVRIPKEKITVISGVSGSGKSSLAFDTIYHESQKQYIDLLASNTFQGTDFKDSMVKKITGLQPSIAIEQKSLGMNPRSTVASVTKIGEYLRLLFATVGDRICPYCKEIVPENNVCSSCGTIFFTLTPAIFSYNHPEYMCPVCKGLGEELQVDIDRIVTNPELSILDGASPWWGNLRRHREKPNANWMKGEVLALANDLKEDLEVPFNDLSATFKQELFYGSNGRLVTMNYENNNGRSGTITRPVEGVVNILKRLLVENSTSKAMKNIHRFVSYQKCHRCNGERLLEEGRMVRIGNTRYPEAIGMNITSLRKWCHFTYGNMNENERDKCKELFKIIIRRLMKLEQVGLGYLNLDRSIPSLSGGEAQRLKIANQFGSGLSNILYIMDEPSKGLHPKDYQFLMEAIQDLKRLKNTIILVEHKNELIQMADYLIEIGPGAGHYGGRLLHAGMVEPNTKFIPGSHSYALRSTDIDVSDKLVLKGASTNNLKNIDVSIPLGKFVCVIGVSGSGKSSLIAGTLYPAIMKALGKDVESVGKYERLLGADRISDIIFVSQKAIGKNSRSTPGTYTGAFDLIRVLYSCLEEAKKAKLTKEHFSFNSVKGQCEACKGAGEIAIPMHFMPDISVICDKCNGKRYQEAVLEIQYKGYTISDLLDLEIGEVLEILEDEPSISRILDMLCKVGLSYIKLGQSAATLSGGEAQRIKLAKELSDGRTEGTMYILDEPTSGLHDDDAEKLYSIIYELISKGATIVTIEHNPKLIRQADYIIEMGPEGGERGGYLINEGWLQTPMK
jgi:excinuclease ABC A subunit